MSTKIYDGFRLTDGTDVFGFADAARQTLNPLRDRLDARELAGRAAALIDRARFGKLTESDDADTSPLRSPLWQAFGAFEAEQRKLDPALRGHDPHRFEFCLGRDPETGMVVGIAYFDEAEYRAPFEALPGYLPFGYWNNSDAPQDVTEQEWDLRRDVWDRVLPMGAVPAERMLSFRLRSDPCMGMWGLLAPGAADRLTPIVEQVPDLHTRAAGMLCSRILHAMLPGAAGGDTVRFVIRYARAAEQVARRHIFDVSHLFEPITVDDLTSPLQSSADGATERLAALDTVAAGLVDEVKEYAQ